MLLAKTWQGSTDFVYCTSYWTNQTRIHYARHTQTCPAHSLSKKPTSGTKNGQIKGKYLLDLLCGLPHSGTYRFNCLE